MKVYRVVADVNQYQSLSPTDEEIWATERLTFDGSGRVKSWTAPEVFVLHPLLAKGDFMHLAPGTIVARPRALELLAKQFEMAGEILPLQHEGESLGVLNVTECINALDEDRTVWLLDGGSGRRVFPKSYVFRSDRFTDAPLFKIPPTCRGELLTVEGLRDPEDEFKTLVEANGLTGLRFVELWSG
jgi:hypothetical protein